ncbi:MAG: NUDIX domain-containing protein, partial [Candidatus Poribacteria bacterium]|nr:NUDIX domain-containing protein [Candidatus Poribacteria bacterium]
MTPPIYVRASVVIRRGDSILMIDRTNDAPFQRYILPGGSVEVNEYSHNAVVREAYEEIGVQVADPVFLGMREFVNA